MTEPLAQRLERERLSQRSPLYRWLYENRDEVARYLPPNKGTPSVVAKVAKEQAGLKVSRQDIYSTWRRVQADQGKQATAKPAPKFEIAERNTASAGHQSGHTAPSSGSSRTFEWKTPKAEDGERYLKK